jgi:uncharacterized protein YkwD
VLLLAAAMFTPGGPAGPERAAAAGLIAPPAVCPDLYADGGKAEMAKARRSMVCMVNHARRKKGLRKYHAHPRLNWSAGKKATDILRCTFSHTACGRPFDFWIRRSGYLGEGGWATGENIAWGSGSLGSVRSIFIAWMKSPGHRNAILDHRFRDVGAGVVDGRFEGIPGVRIWVLHFGDN